MMRCWWNEPMRILCGLLLVATACPLVTDLLGQEASRYSAEALAKWLKRYPEADTDRDGALSMTEARSLQKTLKKKKAKAGEEPPAGAPAAGNGEPTFAEVAYGPHERQRIDVWKASSSQPTPVLIFYHGGSFKAGDKGSIRSRPILAECLKAGISVVSANYRFSHHGSYPVPMEDGARVVQFVRSKADAWNLDAERIAVSGSSAGALMALWIGLHEDLADPQSQDPIARLSTRVRCVAAHSGTASIEPDYIQTQTGTARSGPAIYALFGVASESELLKPEVLKQVQDASPLNHADATDPELFLTYGGKPEDAPFRQAPPSKGWIHHVCLGIPLAKKYESLGLHCELYHAGKKAPESAEIDFLKVRLAR